MVMVTMMSMKIRMKIEEYDDGGDEEGISLGFRSQEELTPFEVSQNSVQDDIDDGDEEIGRLK